MICVEQLVKRFGEREALKQLSLQVKAGEFLGLLGPNGAGKTTLIRILTLLSEATSGKLLLDGKSPQSGEQEWQAAIGVVPQKCNLDSDLTVEENLDLHGRLHHLPAPLRCERIERLLELVELKERRCEFVQALSGGMKQRLLIARALMHQPKVLFLDEPTVGLDPQVRRTLWELLRRLNKDGLTVLLTTHYIEEAKMLCSRVVILNEGRCIADGAPQELCRRVGPYVVEWQENGKSNFQFFHEREEAADYTSALANDTVLRQANLEDVFVQLTGRKVAG